MFTLLRSIAVIGVIFYFSPVREAGQPDHPYDREERRPTLPSPRPTPSEPHEGLWSRLLGGMKEEAVRSVADEAVASAGVRLKEGANRLLADASAIPAPPERPRASGEEWPLRSGYDPFVRCVYRCDGTE
jgi:hypothetical protein